MGIASDDSLATAEAECLTTAATHNFVASVSFADGHLTFWT
jgi:prepilin-type processing-associated H-X9-DG protein